MTSNIVGSLSAVAVVAVVAALASRAPNDVLAGIGPIASRRSARSRAFDLIRAMPTPLRPRVSAATRARLELCGTSWEPSDVAKAELLLGAAVAVVALATVGPVLALPATVLASRAPRLVVARLARRRVTAIDREIPFLLDLLAVATSAGLPPQLALRMAVGGAVGPLAEELRRVINATDLGSRWREELHQVSDRVGLPDLRRLVAVLTRSEALGSSLAEEVARVAGDVRETRSALALERARTAPVKMLFPLVFLVLPAFLLLTVVPVLVTTVRSIA